MRVSWSICGVHFKSPRRAVARSLFVSRKNWARKFRELKAERDESKTTIERLQVQLQSNLHQLRQCRQQLEAEQLKQAQTARQLPADLPLPHHGYGPKLMALTVNLVRVAGLRGAEQCLKLFFEYLGVEEDVPHWTAIRIWLQRIGVASLKEDLEQADDWVWMADHSNQIGQEKILVVLALRASEMPPPGTAIRHDQLRVLTVRPGIHWKREDVAKVYQELAQRHPVPRAVVSDGAVELREAAQSLGAQTIVLQDFKHKAANYFKSLIEKEPRFKAFNGLLGQTRSAIQQTELSHLTPPSQKPKARFMNLSATLHWGLAVLWLLQHPDAETRQFVTTERLEEKLGWIRAYDDDLAAWSECQQVVDVGLTFMNQQGLFRGAAEKLRGALPNSLQHTISQQLANKLVDFVAESEQQLKDSERLPLSTEILESSFGLYKQLEGQHSRGGFTTLLASFGALLKKATPESVRQSLLSVSVKEMRQWNRDNLGLTVRAKRKATYQEFKSQTKCATTSYLLS